MALEMKKLSQYKKLAAFLYKYGTSSLVKNAGLSDEMDDGWEQKEESDDVTPEELTTDLIAMGPAFIKLGQLLSTRPDLLPQKFIEALADLQDKVPPVEFEKVNEIIQEDLGVRISKAFNSFDEIPLASASLGQVHRAELRDGTKVVVKVQRPGIREKIQEELEVLGSAASFMEENTRIGKQIAAKELFAYFKKTLFRELDYQKEARNMLVLADNLKNFEHLIIPDPVVDYTTSRILTMKYLDGEKITAITPLRKLELDGITLVKELFEAYLQQIVIDGFMHADPHPGNIHLTEDNKIALLDVGMVAYFGEEYKEHYLKLLLYLGEANGDKLAGLLIEMSRELEEVRPEQFKQDIGLLVQENEHMTMENLQTGKLIFEVIKIAGDYGYVLPVSLSLLGKALLNLDQVGASIAPDFNPRKAIQRHVTDLMRKYVYKNMVEHHFFTTALESKEFIELLPGRLNKLLHNLAENQWEMKIESLDEKQLMSGFQKVANRITMGLIVAALLISASMLMSIPSGFTLFGYPGLAMLTLILAFVGAGIVGVQILFKDR
ncbi:hypothetical protein KUV50_11975 [Membranicola marinus]|uniref:Protein kinase domain-containing protein n=1 Tax=Membranihabitans marinus TaxID=1227546 RepID=A0A953LDH1_9BACT|nr:AarF/UbiB family protein [Membranihabitans marinus]MBY5958859.1 hypothetical protein [Membranihabitans marinus]